MLKKLYCILPPVLSESSSHPITRYSTLAAYTEKEALGLPRLHGETMPQSEGWGEDKRFTKLGFIGSDRSVLHNNFTWFEDLMVTGVWGVMICGCG